MESYESHVPIGEFKFPMDRMTQKSGPIAMNYEGLLQHLQTKPYWYIARIYKNFNGQLDMHIRWSYAQRVHYYVLEFDPLLVQIGDDYELYPTPRDWYRARAAINTGKSWTLPEYAAMSVPWTDDEPIAADPIETAGGTVFLCMVCFFIFGPARLPLYDFLLFRLFPFLVCSLLSFVVSTLIISILLLSRFSANAF